VNLKSRLAAVVAVLGLMGGLLGVTPQPVEAAINSPIWVGSPLANGRVSSLPRDHKPVNSGGQSALDIKPTSSDWSVRLYVAPKYGANHDRITARITEAGASRCGAGYWAKVTIYDNGVAVGKVHYNHLASQPAKVGVYRWGGYIGRVGNFNISDGTCWTGPHVHMEVQNLVPGTNACFHNLGSQTLVASNYLGYIGHKIGYNPSRLCPSWV
jgi:hypothetical protein